MEGTLGWVEGRRVEELSEGCRQGTQEARPLATWANEITLAGFLFVSLIFKMYIIPKAFGPIVDLSEGLSRLNASP